MEIALNRIVKSRRLAMATGALALAATAVVIPLCRYGGAQAAQEKEGARAAGQDQATSLSDQTDLAITVYNSNIALVRDVRNLSLPGGLFRLKFMDIAATVNPATVHFRSLNEPEKLGVIEQNYEYDLLEPAKLLHKYVGKEVTLVRSYQENGTTKREEIKATLLADTPVSSMVFSTMQSSAISRKLPPSFRSPRGRRRASSVRQHQPHD